MRPSRAALLLILLLSCADIAITMVISRGLLRLRGCRPHRQSCGAVVMDMEVSPPALSKAAEDAASNERLVAALFDTIEEAEEAIQEADPAIASHLQLERDEAGEPVQLRFVYVDEQECIGCTYCASVARNTFFMEEDAGRARAFAQGRDEPEVVMEAIDCCPVNCISFVDYEDLVILESEREGVMINQRSAGMRHADTHEANSMGVSKAKGGSGAMCCNNCPSKGCKECPMYGVGRNPVYLERLEAKEARREASGEAERERFDDMVQGTLDVLYDAPAEDAYPGMYAEEGTGVVVPGPAAVEGALEEECAVGDGEEEDSAETEGWMGEGAPPPLGGRAEEDEAPWMDANGIDPNQLNADIDGVLDSLYDGYVEPSDGEGEGYGIDAPPPPPPPPPPPKKFGGLFG